MTNRETRFTVVTMEGFVPCNGGSFGTNVFVEASFNSLKAAKKRAETIRTNVDETTVNVVVIPVRIKKGDRIINGMKNPIENFFTRNWNRVFTDAWFRNQVIRTCKG